MKNKELKFELTNRLVMLQNELNKLISATNELHTPTKVRPFTNTKYTKQQRIHNISERVNDLTRSANYLMEFILLHNARY
jgi:hypothetical protein